LEAHSTIPNTLAGFREKMGQEKRKGKGRGGATKRINAKGAGEGRNEQRRGYHTSTSLSPLSTAEHMYTAQHTKHTTHSTQCD